MLTCADASADVPPEEVEALVGVGQVHIVAVGSRGDQIELREVGVTTDANRHHGDVGFGVDLGAGSEQRHGACGPAVGDHHDGLLHVLKTMKEWIIQIA